MALPTPDPRLFKRISTLTTSGNLITSQFPFMRDKVEQKKTADKIVGPK